MKKLTLISVAIAWLVTPLPAQPTEKVGQAIALFNASIEAHGGSVAVAGVRDTKSTGRVTTFKADGTSMQFSIAVYTRGFNLLRTEIQGSGLSKVYVSNGQVGWVTRNGRKKWLTAEEVSGYVIEVNPIVGIFGAYRQNQLQLEYHGLISEKKYHHVTAYVVESPQTTRVPARISRRFEIAIDAVTNLVASMLFFEISPKGVNPEAREEYVYSDYRSVGALLVPFLVRHFVNHQKVTEITLEHFELTQHGSIFQEP